jgi:CRISPR system Cascade subunit CasB
MSVNFKSDTPLGQILNDFWQTLEKDKGSRAQLRRCKTPDEVVMVSAFHHLCRRIQPLMKGERDGCWQMRIAAIAGLLAHIRKLDSRKTLAEQMAEGDSPVVSELRFRRLLQRDRRNLYGALIRILGLLDKKANPFDLAQSVYYWGDGERKRWAFAYFPNIPEKKSA